MDNGAIFTAVIGASAATIGIAISKDAKLSELRQQWIDGLREDVSEFLAAQMDISDHVKYVLPSISSAVEKWDKVSPKRFRANYLATKIKLRLDFKKESSRKLMEAISALISQSKLPQEDGTTLTRVNGIQELTSYILEDAWHKVKRGELRFVIAQCVAFTSLLVSLAVVGWKWHHHTL